MEEKETDILGNTGPELTLISGDPKSQCGPQVRVSSYRSYEINGV